MGSSVGGTAPHGNEDSMGTLVTRASQQLSELVREEMRLAQAELTEKGKRYGLGGGLVGGAGLVAVLASQAAVAAGIAALALVLPVWAAALVVAALLVAVAAALALNGRKQLAAAGNPAPEQTIDSVRADIAEIKERTHR